MLFFSGSFFPEHPYKDITMREVTNIGSLFIFFILRSLSVLMNFRRSGSLPVIRKPFEKMIFAVSSHIRGVRQIKRQRWRRPARQLRPYPTERIDRLLLQDRWPWGSFLLS